MKTLLFISTFILLASNQLIAQNSLIGKVLDDKASNPIPFANILLLQPIDSSLIVGTVSDESGIFKFENVKNGTYTLSISSLGFKDVLTQVEINADINVGTLNLEAETTLLNEISITEKRQLFTRKIDRLVFDVENSSKASEGDALEVLKVTPGIRVQNDNITMIGKNQLAIMVNEKLVNISQEELANYLSSIPSEDIKNIEVITTPPAKYEATGNSGIINITLKEAKKDYWNAQIRSSYRQKRFGNGSLGANFNFNKNKFSLSSSTNLFRGIYYQEQDDYIYFDDGLWYTSSPFKRSQKAINSRIDLRYQINSSWTIGAQYFFNHRDNYYTDQPFTATYEYETNDTLRILQSNTFMDFHTQFHSVNFNNEFLLDTLGKSISVDLDYFSFDMPDKKQYEGTLEESNLNLINYFGGLNFNKQNVINSSLNIAVSFPTKWINLSYGAKISQSKSTNNIDVFNSGFVDLPVAEYPLTTNDFKYTENIEAAYLSADKKLNSKWRIQAGLRMEATQTKSESTFLTESVQNDYIKFFPTLFLAYSNTENSTFTFSYSKRIQRPQFFALNPNVYFVNPFQLIGGNAFLQPAFIDNFELSHTFKNFVSKAYFTIEDNLFEQVPLPNSDTYIIEYTNENYINSKRFGFSENYTFNKIKWWTSNNSIDLNYTVFDFTLEEDQDQQKGINTTFSTYNDFTLNKAKTFSGSINFWYNFPGIAGIFDTKSAGVFSLALNYHLLNKKMNISLRANDIFKTQADRLETTVNNIYQEARYYYDSRSIQLSLSYKFGNSTLKSNRRNSGNTEERRRTGN